MRILRELTMVLVVVSTMAGNARSLASPVVVSSSPANGATGVAVSSPVVFTFDTPMLDFTPYLSPYIPDSMLPFRWSPAVSFTYSMSPDGLQLICTPKTSLPGNTTITWTLNPDPDGVMQLTDLDDNPLPATTGSFTTAAGGQQPTETNFTSCVIGKTLGYNQTDATTVEPYSDTPAIYAANVVGTPQNPTTAATLTVPGVSQPRTLISIFGQTYDMQAFASQTALDAAFPVGTYTFAVTRLNDSFTTTASMTSDYPPTPVLSNYDAAQELNPSASFTFQWTPIANAKSEERIYLTIEDQNNATNIFSVTNSGTTASVTIPAGTLKPNTTYHGSLSFSRLVSVSTNTTKTFSSVAALSRVTYFPITTIGGTASKPKFASYQSTNGKFSMNLTAQPGNTLVIESSTDLLNWQTVLTTNVPASGSLNFVPTMDALPRFYRAHH